MHKDVERVLISQEEIKAAVASLAAQIQKDYKNKNLLVVGLLKGSVLFVSDLIRELNLDLSIDFIVASSYYNGTESTGHVTISKDLSMDVSDKDILLVEDVVDTGVTLQAVLAHLQKKNPKSLKVCTLIDKPARRKVHLVPDYCGKELGDDFIIGYGLDFCEKYRNLGYIGVLKKSVYL